VYIKGAHMEPRPYYHRFAWAYDLLQSRPITERIGFIIGKLQARDVRPPKLVLDAGCGTGRYSAELASEGFNVIGVDRSPELIKIARERRVRNARFEVCNLLAFAPPAPCSAVLCRGVLNDFTDDVDRRLIFQRFADWLAPGGVLIFDIRDWNASAARYEEQPLFNRHVALEDAGELLFASCTTPNHRTHELCIRETFEHRHGQDITKTENVFTMRCWSRGELKRMLAKSFHNVSILPTYGEPDGMWKDRLVVIATVSILRAWPSADLLNRGYQP
jgi:SAM-dependent methyltransferase